MVLSCYSLFDSEQTQPNDLGVASPESGGGQVTVSSTLSPLHDPSTAGEAAAELTYPSEPHSDHTLSPPLTDDGTPETDQSSIEISTRFNFNFELDPILPDTFLLTADSIFFAVHSHRLRAASIGTFGGMLPLLASASSSSFPISFTVPEQSSVINILLCAAYELSSNVSNPSLECIAEAVQAMKRYGMLPLERFMSRGTPLYDTILHRAPVLPIEAFALVGAEDLEELAIACSSYTLHLKLYLISDELATKMGVVYLNRLYRLQGTRMSALKDMLRTPIYPHTAKPYCSVEQRQSVNRAYALGAAKVYYDATPALSGITIKSNLDNVASLTKCPDCKSSLVAHVKELVTKWMLLQRTI